MIKTYNIYFLVILFAVITSVRAQQTHDPYAAITKDLTSFRLENGLQVLLIRDAKVDHSVVRLLVDRPLVAEKDKVGLGQLTEQMLLTNPKVSEQLTAMSGSLSVSDRVLEGRVPEVGLFQMLELMAEVVRRPAFSPTELERVKGEMVRQEQRRSNDPTYISEQLAEQLIFGIGHPYGARRSAATVDNISLADIRSFHQTYFRPAIAKLVIVSNADAAELKTQIERYFGDWKAEVSMFAQFFNPALLPESTRYNFVNLPDAEMASIYMGYAYRLSPREPDALAVRLLEALLNTKLRAKEWFPQDGTVMLSADPHLGQLRIALTVPTAQVEPAILETRALMYTLRDSLAPYLGLRELKKDVVDEIRAGLSDEKGLAREGTEILRYKRPIFDFGMDRGRIAQDPTDNAPPSLMHTDYMLAFGAKYPIGNEEIKQAARDYLIPGRMQVVVVGNRSLIPLLQQLNGANSVHFFNADGEVLIAATPGIQAEQRDANAIIVCYLEAIGGREQLLRVQDVKMVLAGELQGTPFVKTQIRTRAGAWYEQSNVGKVLMDKTVVTDSSVMFYRGLTEQILTEQVQAELREAGRLFPELSYQEKGYQLKVSGTTRIGGVVVDEITITSPTGQVQTDYYAQKTGLRVRTVSRVGGKQLVREFLDYRPYKGILFPYQVIYSGLVTEPISFQLKSLAINAGVDAKLFE